MSGEGEGAPFRMPPPSDTGPERPGRDAVGEGKRAGCLVAFLVGGPLLGCLSGCGYGLLPLLSGAPLRAPEVYMAMGSGMVGVVVGAALGTLIGVLVYS